MTVVRLTQSAHWLCVCHAQAAPGHEAWYQLLMCSLDHSACRDVLLQWEAVAAVLEQLQQAGKDPQPVHTAVQEAKARAELTKLQRKLTRQLDAVADDHHLQRQQH